MNTLLFVYGTLKRGGSNHRQMGDAKYVGEAQTTHGYRLFDVGGYPALVRDPAARIEIHGEVWEVGPARLVTLDEFEGTHEGLFRRERIRLGGAFGAAAVDCYLYGRDPAGLRELGARWTE